MIYCKIENGVVINRATFADTLPDGWAGEGDTWVQNDDAQIGWTYDGTSFTAPVVDSTPQVPQLLTASQAKRQLLAMGLMTADEALSNDIPAFLKAVLDQMVASNQAADAGALALRWHNATQWLRDDPLFTGGLLDAAAQVLNVPANDATLDQFFIAAAQL